MWSTVIPLRTGVGPLRSDFFQLVLLV